MVKSAALVIRLTALGDVALTAPVIRALRARWPAMAVDLVTDVAYAEWAADALGVRRAVAYDRRGRDAGLRGVWSVRRRLPQRPYDLVVDLQGKPRTRALVGALRPRRALVVRRRGPWRLLRAAVGRDGPDHDRHATEQMLEVLAPLGVGLPSEPPALRLRPPSPLEPGLGPRVGVCIGGSRATKRWPLVRFADVIQGLAARFRGLRFVAIGGAGDRPDFEALRGLTDGRRWEAPAALEGGVTALAAAICGLTLLISNDTGPAHLARGYGVPTVVMFGPTSWIRWGPAPGAAGEHRVVRSPVDCAPCSNFGSAACPRRDRDWACMRELRADSVYAAAVELLARRGVR